MRDARADETSRVYSKNGPRPAQFMPEHLGKGIVRECMTHEKPWNVNVIPKVSDSGAYGVIIGQVVGEGMKAANFIQGVTAQGNGGAKARLSQASGQTRHHAGQEMQANTHAGQLRPDASRLMPIIQTSEQPCFSVRKKRAHIVHVIFINGNVAVS